MGFDLDSISSRRVIVNFSQCTTASGGLAFIRSKFQSQPHALPKKNITSALVGQLQSDGMPKLFHTNVVRSISPKIHLRLASDYDRTRRDLDLGFLLQSINDTLVFVLFAGLQLGEGSLQLHLFIDFGRSICK